MTEHVDELVTTPSGYRIHFNPRNHRYKLGHDAESMTFVPSVSTILGDTLPKNLSGWAERGAVDGLLSLSRAAGIVFNDTDSALKAMQRNGLRHWQRRDAAALRGTTVHKAFELLGDGKVPNIAKAPADQRGYVQAIAAWWLDAQPEVEHNELMVGSWEHMFAGRLDLIARLKDGRRGIIDLKTSSAVRDSHHFQMAGYQIGVEESGYGDVDFRAVLRVANDGTYEFVESWATPDQFTALLAGYRAIKKFTKDTPPEHKRKKKAA